MSFIYQHLRDRERTCIKEKVKSRSKYTCSEIPYDPVEMTASKKSQQAGAELCQAQPQAVLSGFLLASG